MGYSTDKPASLADRLDQLRARALNASKVSFEVKIQTSGNGVGTVSRTPYAESYNKGQVVSLIARAESGSKFVRWMNDASGSHPPLERLNRPRLRPNLCRLKCSR